MSTDTRVAPESAHAGRGLGRLRMVVIATAAASLATTAVTLIQAGGASAAVGAIAAPHRGGSGSGVYTVYPNGTVPNVLADGDPNSVELGVSFKAGVGGSVTGIRFYKATTNTGTHTGALWTAGGQKLAGATFTSESASGWQSVSFATPVAIKAGTTYVASYHTSTGHYSTAEYAFASGSIGNSALSATSGTYAYGSGGFPNSSWHSTAYYVDVTFVPGTAPGSRSTRPNWILIEPPATNVPAPTATDSSSTAPATQPATSTAPTSTPPATTAPVTPPSSSSAPVAPPSSSSAAPAGAVGCEAHPSVCGYPDATNTGVPAGMALRASGGLTISSDGAVVSGLDVTGCVRITASNVVFKNSKVHGDCGGSPMISVSYSGVSGVVIDHVEIDGGKTNPSSPGVTGAGYSLGYANIHGTGDGVDIQNNDSVHDSYIHDLYVAPGDHTDAIQSAGGTGSNAVHNTILAGCNGCNSAMIIGADLGPIGTFTASNNLIDGGGFTLYAGTGGYDSGSISFVNNRFGSNYGYGLTSFKPSVGRTVAFAGNVWDATGSTCNG